MVPEDPSPEPVPRLGAKDHFLTNRFQYPPQDSFAFAATVVVGSIEKIDSPVDCFQQCRRHLAPLAGPHLLPDPISSQANHGGC